MAEKPSVPAAGDNKNIKDENNLEDLVSSLHKQIKSTDWLKQNTAEKWEEEHPELAAEFKKAKESEDKEAGT